MEILASLLIGIIIGSVITYVVLTRSRQSETAQKYESQIQLLKEQHQQEIAAIKDIYGSLTSTSIVSEFPPSNKAYSVEDIRETYPKAYAAWTKDEDRRLWQRYQQGAKINDLAQEFQRKPGAIRSRLKKLGFERAIAP
ncbi:MAG: hypothetical protein Fur0046_20000 [Cyanobacteria bacterium J069]|nr:MAG: hypothetical protein D6742_13855 [Cyanobacteria bacterium J069]